MSCDRKKSDRKEECAIPCRKEECTVCESKEECAIPDHKEELLYLTIKKNCYT